jgi:hypothetical protein
MKNNIKMDILNVVCEEVAELSLFYANVLRWTLELEVLSIQILLLLLSKYREGST